MDGMEGPAGLRIERLMDKTDERAVRSISDNRTQQEGNMQVQWNQP